MCEKRVFLYTVSVSRRGGFAFGLHARRTRTGRRRRSAGTNSPVDCWLARGRVPGECGGQQGLTGGSLTESVGLLFCCYSPGRRVGASSGTRTARAGRLTSRPAKTPLRGVFRAREIYFLRTTNVNSDSDVCTKEGETMAFGNRKSCRFTKIESDCLFIPE